MRTRTNHSTVLATLALLTFGTVVANGASQRFDLGKATGAGHPPMAPQGVAAPASLGETFVTEDGEPYLRSDGWVTVGSVPVSSGPAALERETIDTRRRAIAHRRNPGRAVDPLAGDAELRDEKRRAVAHRIDEAHRRAAVAASE